MRRLLLMALAVFALWTWPEVALIGSVLVSLWLVVDAVRRAPIVIPGAPLSGRPTRRERRRQKQEERARRAARKALRRSLARPTESLSERARRWS